MMLNEHLEPVKTRLQAHAMLAAKVEDVVRVTQAGDSVRANYVVVSVNLPHHVAPRLAGVAPVDGDTAVEVYARVVATAVDGVNMLMDAVHTQLQGFVVSVPGRALTPLNRDDLEQIEWDRTANLYFRDVWYTATSSRVDVGA